MKTATSLLVVLTVGLTQAAEKPDKPAKKEVTLQGMIMCAKCALKKTKKCQTVIQVQRNGKKATYYFADKGSREDYHEDVCGGERKKGTVTGYVSKKNGKRWIKPTKVKYDEE